MTAPNNNIFGDAFKDNFGGPRNGYTLQHSSFEKENVNRSNTLEHQSKKKRVPPKTATAKQRTDCAPQYSHTDKSFKV